jgi:hypothetical protein
MFNNIHIGVTFQEIELLHALIYRLLSFKLKFSATFELPINTKFKAGIHGNIVNRHSPGGKQE